MNKGRWAVIVYFILAFLILNLPILIYGVQIFRSNNPLFGFYSTFLLVEFSFLLLLFMVLLVKIFFHHIPEQIENYFKNK